jgi:REP-associated tyrosine transposase
VVGNETSEEVFFLWWHVTLCAYKIEDLFGEVVDGEMILNDVGEMVNSVWEGIPRHNKRVRLDEKQVMPNHFHGIISVSYGPARCPAPTFLLSKILQQFKSITTGKYLKVLKLNNEGLRPYKLWQKGYYDNCILEVDVLEQVREYIRENPTNWKKDRYYKNVGAGHRASTKNGGSHNGGYSKEIQTNYGMMYRKDNHGHKNKQHL